MNWLRFSNPYTDPRLGTWFDESLWSALPGEYVVDITQYTNDFQTMVQQLVGEGDDPKSFPWKMTRVTVRPFEDFQRWAQAEEPDWDRYTWDAVKELVSRELLPEKALDDYDSPATWEKIRTLMRGSDTPALRIGFAHYVQSLATSLMLSKANMPPLVSVEGAPADGRHRTLAATLLGLRYAPVLDLPQGSQP